MDQLTKWDRSYIERERETETETERDRDRMEELDRQTDRLRGERGTHTNIKRDRDRDRHAIGCLRRPDSEMERGRETVRHT